MHLNEPDNRYDRHDDDCTCAQCGEGPEPLGPCRGCDEPSGVPVASRKSRRLNCHKTPTANGPHGAPGRTI